MTTPTNPPAGDMTAPSEGRRTRLGEVIYGAMFEVQIDLRYGGAEKAEYIADAVRRALEEAEPGDHPDSEGDNVPSLAPALTLAELDVIEARAGTVWDEIEIDNTERVIIQDRQRLMSWPTAEFIAAARTDVPALVAALRQAWATNASLRVGWKVDMRKAREAQAELDHIRSELDVQRYHAEHDPCDVCSHLEAVELGELIDRLTLDVLGRTAERDRARSVAVALEAEVERLRAGIEERVVGWSLSLTAASCAESLRRLLTPPDAQEPAQEPRTGAGGPGVPDEGCEAVSSTESPRASALDPHTAAR